MAGVLIDENLAADLIEMRRLFRRFGWPGQSSMVTDQTLTQRPIYFTNDSGATIPPYGCIQITGTEEIGGQNFLVADQPADSTGDAGSFLFNSHNAVADGAQGVAQSGPVVRAFKDTGTVTAGDKWQPVSGQWYIEQDDAGLLVIAGADDIDSDVVKVFMPVGGSSSSSKLVLATSGITARSSTTVGSGTCTEYKIVGTTLTTNANTFTVYNIDAVAIPSGMYLMATKEAISGFWIAQHPGIINLRLSGNDLQYTLDGTTWTTWHTATTCS